MQRFEEIATGIMMIGVAVIVLGIACVGVFFFLKDSNFVPLTLLCAIGFLALYTVRCMVIGVSIILHGRYLDDMILQDNRRYFQ